MKWGLCSAVLLILASQMGHAEESTQKTEVAQNNHVPGTLVADKEMTDDDLHTDLMQSQPRDKKKDALNPEGQNTTSAAISSTAKSKWSGSFESRNEYVVTTIQGNPGNGSTNDTYIMARLNYLALENLKLTVGLDMDHNLLGADAPADQRQFNSYDNAPFLAATIPKVATLPFDVNVSLSGRVYAPTAGVMQDDNFVGTRVYAFLTKDVGNFSFAYIAQGRNYIGAHIEYNYVNPNNSTTPLESLSFRLIEVVEVAYKFNDLFSVYQDLGVDDQFANDGVQNGVYYYSKNGGQVSNEILESAVNYTPNAIYRLTTGFASYEHNYRTQGFTLYGPETRVFVSGAASF